ncbi:hypothetical protein [Hymenobacter sp. YC55]|uniref:hypothetical protein n=1 Tax=Hymenobacter sp. YC55 TaxID=3034019 RepID=UPI0023F96D6A|nr:hypothetical protein [Hymenobacter sp. YC55]MDF7811694.1 hypothetical protein [Hymenobacter sp. YC55]
MSDTEDFSAELANGNRIYFEYAGAVEDIGWEEVDLQRVKAYFHRTPYVYSLTYRGIEFIKKALVHIANSPDYLIDNDFGTLVSGHEFAKKVQEAPDWCWYNNLE